MYGEGISTNAIARFLDAVKIPGKGWHNYMVIRILAKGRGICREAQSEERLSYPIITGCYLQQIYIFFKNLKNMVFFR